MEIEMIGLIVILILVLFLPFTVKKVEHNLEVFLFIMGILAASISGMMKWPLIEKALIDPINITLAVLLAGLLTKWLQGPLEKSILSLNRALSPRIFFALTDNHIGAYLQHHHCNYRGNHSCHDYQCPAS